MQKLISGIHTFETQVFRKKEALFKQLESGQSPAAIFITCADSRINPNLLTQTEPGDLFVLRNAGNIVPPFPEYGGEIASIELALKALDVEDIIICGHSDCGAMKSLLDPDGTEANMPGVCRWLSHAHRTADIIEKNYSHLTEDRSRLTATVEENVLVQIENLRSHPVIAERLKSGKLNLHGWVYKFETGQVFSYEAESGQFQPLSSLETPRPVYPKELHGATLRAVTME